MRKLDQVRALFEPGTVLVTVRNTYRPELDGTRRRVRSLGRTVYSCDILDGPTAGRAFRGVLPARARDVLAVDTSEVTFRLGRGDHTVTLRREAVQPPPRSGSAPATRRASTETHPEHTPGVARRKSGVDRPTLPSRGRAA